MLGFCKNNLIKQKLRAMSLLLPLIKQTQITGDKVSSALWEKNPNPRWSLNLKNWFFWWVATVRALRQAFLGRYCTAHPKVCLFVSAVHFATYLTDLSSMMLIWAEELDVSEELPP